jgi:formate hydrogenlyase subunit 6/NADH:ubiquinone oxidoreductase subunit I
MSNTITPSCTGCTACAGKCPVGAISGERRQVHGIDPSLCIDCGACGRICPVEAVLDETGRPVRAVRVGLWPRPTFNYRACVKCLICVAACPAGSIALVRSLPRPWRIDGAYPILVDAKTCVGCGFCAESCPTDAIVMQAPAENLG